MDTAVSPWFTWTGNALIDLGVHPYSYLFNYGLIFEGIMNFLFAYGLMKVFRLSNANTALLMISGISLGLVGIFVETYHLYHLTFALVYFIAFPASVLIFSRHIASRHRIQSLVGYACEAVSLFDIVAGILLGFNAVPGIALGLAIPEFIEAALLGGWGIYISVWVLSLSRSLELEARETAPA